MGIFLNQIHTSLTSVLNLLNIIIDNVHHYQLYDTGFQPSDSCRGHICTGQSARSRTAPATILPAPSSLSPGRAREKRKKGRGRTEEGEKGKKLLWPLPYNQVVN